MPREAARSVVTAGQPVSPRACRRPSQQHPAYPALVSHLGDTGASAAGGGGAKQTGGSRSLLPEFGAGAPGSHLSSCWWGLTWPPRVDTGGWFPDSLVASGQAVLTELPWAGAWLSGEPAGWGPGGRSA